MERRLRLFEKNFARLTGLDRIAYWERQQTDAIEVVTSHRVLSQSKARVFPKGAVNNL